MKRPQPAKSDATRRIAMAPGMNDQMRGVAEGRGGLGGRTRVRGIRLRSSDVLDDLGRHGSTVTLAEYRRWADTLQDRNPRFVASDPSELRIVNPTTDHEGA